MTRRKILTDDQRAWLAEHYSQMTNAELLDALRVELGVTLTLTQLRNIAAKSRWIKEPRTRDRAVSVGMGGMSSDELDFVREHTPGYTWRETAAAFERRYGRSLTRGQVKYARTKAGAKVGCNPVQFKRGHVPWTKGKKWDDYMDPEAQRKLREGGTLFRKGVCDPRTEARRRHLLDLYEDVNGRVQIYVAPRNAAYPAQRWIGYAQFVWMQANGQDWPEGNHAAFADHNDHNFAPGNIVPVPNDLLPFVMGGGHGHALPYHDRESLELAIAHARLVRARAAAQRKLKEAVA